MKTSIVKEKARQMGIATLNVTKDELIRAIQVKEGNFPCFKSVGKHCDQTFCAWKKECLPNN
jgi:hypothetical protein